MKRVAGYAAAGLLVVLVFLVFTPYVRSPARAFSLNTSHQLQTNALLAGRLAGQPGLPERPRYDWFWGRNGLYSPWSVGLPMLRVPFQAIAHACGGVGFPDRIFTLML